MVRLQFKNKIKLLKIYILINVKKFYNRWWKENIIPYIKITYNDICEKFTNIILDQLLSALYINWIKWWIGIKKTTWLSTTIVFDILLYFFCYLYNYNYWYYWLYLVLFKYLIGVTLTFIWKQPHLSLISLQTLIIPISVIYYIIESFIFSYNPYTLILNFIISRLMRNGFLVQNLISPFSWKDRVYSLIVTGPFLTVMLLYGYIALQIIFPTFILYFCLKVMTFFSKKKIIAIFTYREIKTIINRYHIYILVPLLILSINWVVLQCPWFFFCKIIIICLLIFRFSKLVYIGEYMCSRVITLLNRDLCLALLWLEGRHICLYANLFPYVN